METESFHTTRWTLVRHATGQSPEGRKALNELCAAYYEPVVAFLRRDGRDADAARETAHDFFQRLLEAPNLGGAEPGRGRFRSYLLGALKHHLGHQREKTLRQKRGAGAETIPIAPGTDTSPGFDVGDPQALPPDSLRRLGAAVRMAQSVETITADAPFACPLLRQRIGSGSHRQRCMKSSVECRYLWNPWQDLLDRVNAL